MNSKAKIWFSAGELSLLGGRRVAGLPTTMPGCTGRAKKEEWLSREAPCMGGKAGMRTEYQPPAPVQVLIQSFLAANPEFFAKSKSRTKADLASISKEVFGDAPARYTQNPNADFEVLLKRLGEATQATVRISKQFDCPLPTEWTSLIQELMAMHGLTETGAKRVIDELLKAHAR